MAASLPLCSVNHVSRVVSDVRASTAFYRDILGFAEIKRPNSFDFDGSWLWSYSVGIHLIEGTPIPRPSEIDPKSDHLSFQAECLADVERRLEELGIHYVKQVLLEGGMEVEQVFFHDPDNNMIEVCNCNCLPIMPLERSPSFCACAMPGKQQLQATAANNNQCDSLNDSGDEFDLTQ